MKYVMDSLTLIPCASCQAVPVQSTSVVTVPGCSRSSFPGGEEPVLPVVLEGGAYCDVVVVTIPSRQSLPRPAPLMTLTLRWWDTSGTHVIVQLTSATTSSLRDTSEQETVNRRQWTGDSEQSHNMKRDTSGGGCLCFSSRSVTFISGATSVLWSLSVILVSIYLLVNTAAYSLVTGSLSDWLRQHNRDKEVGVITH